MAFEYAPPKYAQVVEEIKRRIERGDYPAGSLLPSEHQLVEAFAVSRPTIVKALSVLRQEGWIDSQQGKGSFVRDRPAVTDAERSRPAHDVLELPETEMAGELVQAGVKTAPPLVASLLKLDKGTKAFLRQRLLSHDGQPVELASVWLPMDLVAGTDLASPDLLSESLRTHLQSRKRVRFDHATERITSRHPTGEECELLQIASDAPVLGVTVAVYDATRTPLEVVDLVLPGGRHELRDAYPFT
jgi:DNA-binding GntR family transcriptional regulator